MSRLLLLLLLLVLPSVLVAACSSYEPPQSAATGLSKLETGVRHDCNAMLGTAFRATEEREWFEQNCSRWPAVALASILPAAPGQQPGQPGAATVIQGETPQCAAMRGRPYNNETERAWFLQNCIRPEVPAANPAVPNNTQQRPGAAPTSLSSSTAAVCETLRRIPNPTDAQRRWYLTNCFIR